MVLSIFFCVFCVIRCSTSDGQEDVHECNDAGDNGGNVYLDIAEDHVLLSPAPEPPPPPPSPPPAPPPPLAPPPPPVSTNKRMARQAWPQQSVSKKSKTQKTTRTNETVGVVPPLSNDNLTDCSVKLVNSENCSVRLVKREKVDDSVAENVAAGSQETEEQKKKTNPVKRPTRSATCADFLSESTKLAEKKSAKVSIPVWKGRLRRGVVREFTEKKQEEKKREGLIIDKYKAVEEGQVTNKLEKDREEDEEEKGKKETDKNGGKSVNNSGIAGKSEVRPEKEKMDEVPKKKKSLSQMMRFYKNSKRPYECLECRKNFTDRTHCQNHVKTHDDSLKRFQCSYCPAR
jgi:hypothetical protein